MQIFPDTAETPYLDEWAAIWGVSRTAAAAATGTVNYTGVDGNTIPIGTQLQRADLTVFQTTTASTLSGGVGTATVVAVVAGLAGNTAATSTLTFVSPISGVDSTAIIATGGLVGGTDLEDDTTFLQSLLDVIQNPAQAGAESDYENWTFAADPNITRVWVYPLESGPGTVSIRFMEDNLYTDGIPLTADVTVVQNYIDSVRPVTANVTVFAPIAVSLDFTIHLVQNDTAEIRTAVAASLLDMLQRDSSPGGTLDRSRIIESINLTEGVYGCVLTAPAGNVTVADGYISTLGTITWT